MYSLSGDQYLFTGLIRIMPLPEDITEYQAKYVAHELTKRSASDDTEKLAGTLLDVTAQIDLNPHQVDAALFAFRSPLSKGAVLADEVGLGKTIEAGLVISQKWAEQKRRILIIVPANLRKQWNGEMLEKFYLPSTILESKNFNTELKQGIENPFIRGQHELVICSYPFVKAKADFVRAVPWDLVVIDEAHRLRNVYKPGNVTAKAIKDAVEHAPKILLTATPLQNSLLEIYGLTSIIDERVFGDIKSFRQQFVLPASLDNNFDDIKTRLRPVINRTLRKQVLEYVNYPDRHAMVEEFTPTTEEQELYDEVSEYLRRDFLFALPSGQRHLMTLVVRKILASSSFAIASTLSSLIHRLEAVIREDDEKLAQAQQDLDDQYDDLDDLKEELEVLEPESKFVLSDEHKSQVNAEIDELRHFYDKAVGITNNAKGAALLIAIEKAFERISELGGNRKAIIFTESTRTQKYLLELLSNNGYGGKIALFNGSNSDTASKDIYKAYAEKHAGSSKLTGSRTADTRNAIVEHFRDSAEILIATEAASEGINLQFCSLVVNYDLPWNPQRIEQRIGRCHRYGQKHDVVVLNFLNKNNEADRRVYELLDQKFKLFDGVFGSSDEVLGTIESGIDFETKILELYQECRTNDEIAKRYQQLRDDMQESIDKRMESTRHKLIENFDTEVNEKLRISLEQSKQYLGRYEKWLWQVTRQVIGDRAHFADDEYVFDLANQIDHIHTGRFRIGRLKGDHEQAYRLQHPLAQHVINYAKQLKTPTAKLVFNYSDDPQKVHAIEHLVGKTGWLRATKVTIDSFEPRDAIVLAGHDSGGNIIDQNIFQRLLELTATRTAAGGTHNKLAVVYEQAKSQLVQDMKEKDLHFFKLEQDKITRWTEDRLYKLEKELLEVKRQKRDKEREAIKAESPSDIVRIQEDIAKLTHLLRRKRSEIFDMEDEIEKERDELIASIEGRMRQTVSENMLFEVQWEVR